MDKKDDIIEYEGNMKVAAVEAFIDLASTDEDFVSKYGAYIDEYYKLPIASRLAVCNKTYKYFKENGCFNINVITDNIIYEAERLEDHITKEIDPVVSAIRESQKLIEKNPKINVKGIRYE